MSEAKVAERYARAIFELGQETGQLSSLSDQLSRFARELGGSKELSAVLDSPSVDAESRGRLIQALAGRLALGPLCVNALRLLASRGRLEVLPAISTRLQSLADERHGLLRVRVTSARPLPDSYFQRLTSEVETRTGRRVVMERSVDASLIAGVVTQVGDYTVDGTLRGRLAQYEQRLVAGN
jgi:F-type H+-transporting ATPase subunit delta